VRKTSDVAAPQWFTDALATPFEVSETVVDGVVVRARCWGPRGPGVVLVHGGAAHAGWWDHLAPFLAHDRRIVAIDLSGHGDSDRRRDGYGLKTWAREVIAQGEAAGIEGPPFVVGHSMGGYVVLTTGCEHPNLVAGIVIIDSPLPAIPPDNALAENRLEVTPLRYYDTREEALRHFRFVPPDDYVLPYVREHVAAESIIETTAGWTWKFDPESLRRDRRVPTDALHSLTAPLVLFRAGHGLIRDEQVAEMRALLGRRVPVVTIPNAGHHALLDEPVAVAVGLQTAFEGWNSGP
jgi:pimeloyl-ACP methyl ester carboxylesterase